MRCIHFVIILLKQSIPDIDSVPDWVKPSTEKMDPEKMKKELPDSYKERIPNDNDKQRIRDYVDNLDDFSQVTQDYLCY